MRRPIALTDAELSALLYASNVARDDLELWTEDDKLDRRTMGAHERANAKLRAEARRRGFVGQGSET